MDIRNKTQVTMFEFSGLTDDTNLAPYLFTLLFLVYLVTIIGNLGMVSMVHVSSSLHTPMYYFLSCLSLVDLFYSSVITPNLLTLLLYPKMSISFVGCAMQLYLFCALGCTETILLSTMSYDRYVAICHPLHYNLIMTRNKCVALVLYSFLISFIQALVQTSCVFTLPFCGSNLIDHFFCDILPLLKLSCSSTLHCGVITGFIVAAYGMYILMTIFLSYTFIFISIFQMSSAAGRQKAFSTCSSHIICVTIFFLALFSVYLRPHSDTFDIQGKVASVFYTIMSPMLNPLIYSLRNQEVKRVLVQESLKYF